MKRRGGPRLAKLHTDCKHSVTKIKQTGRQEVIERCLKCGATRTGLKKVKWSWWRMPEVRLVSDTTSPTRAEG